MVFELTAAEKHSGTWASLRKHFTEKLESLRAQNDGNLDLVVTAEIRGQIKAYKALIALDKD